MFQDDKEFQEELQRRIAIITDPNYNDPSFKNLNKFDYTLIAILIVISIIVFILGWI